MASFAGWAGDAFDYQLFSLALPLMLAAWVLTPAMAGTIASVSLIAAAIGGAVGGGLSDRFGRLGLLRGAILLASIATVACAAAQTPMQMLVARAVQGLGFGAEWSAGAVLMAEHAADDRRGRYLGLMQSAWAIGWAGAVAVYLVATMMFDPAVAWRAMFVAGLMPVLIVVWLRGRPEPRPSKVSGGTLETRSTPPVADLMLPALIGLGAHGGYHSLFTWLPTLLRQQPGHSAMRTGIVLLLMTLGFGIGCIVAGRLADRIGRRRAIALFAGLSALAAVAISADVAQSRYAALLAGPIGFAVGGTPAILGTWFSELFPAAHRGAGVGVSYNAGRIASALIPGMIGWASGSAPLAVLIGLTATASYGLILVILPLLPETRDRPFVATAA